MPKFDPIAGERIRWNSTVYKVMEHPAVPNFPFSQEGRKAIVYQVKSNGDLYAFKVFKKAFQDASLVDTCDKLSQLTLPGLEVCERHCLTSSSAGKLVKRYPNIEFSVLMPWIQGSTWFDIVFTKTDMNLDAAKEIAKNTAQVLAGLEERGFAHCDIAGANVIVNTKTGGVHLIDVEDMFGPNLPAPSALPKGTDGYQHKASRAASQGQWRSEGDRFSAAILLAEMLAWHSPQIRQASDEEHYFAPKELQDERCSRYKLMVDTLSGVSDGIADCFVRAWTSSSLEDCPPLSEWARLLAFPMVSAWLPISAPPPKGPYAEFTPIAVNAQPVMGTQFFDILGQLTPQASTSPPNTPAFFRLQKQSGSATYTLLWIGVSDAEGYLIEAADNEQFINASQVYQGSDTSWTDPTPASRKRYYRIRAYNSSGTSAWSNVIETWG